MRLFLVYRWSISPSERINAGGSGKTTHKAGTYKSRYESKSIDHGWIRETGQSVSRIHILSLLMLTYKHKRTNVNTDNSAHQARSERGKASGGGKGTVNYKSKSIDQGARWIQETGQSVSCKYILSLLVLTYKHKRTNVNTDNSAHQARSERGKASGGGKGTVNYKSKSIDQGARWIQETGQSTVFS